jgi:hypothetical protein
MTGGVLWKLVPLPTYPDTSNEVVLTISRVADLLGHFEFRDRAA